jgi:hypothetical protein
MNTSLLHSHPAVLAPPCSIREACAAQWGARQIPSSTAKTFSNAVGLLKDGHDTERLHLVVFEGDPRKNHHRDVRGPGHAARGS